MATLESSIRLKDQFTATLRKVDSGLERASQSMQDFSDRITEPGRRFQDLGDKVAFAMAKINSKVRSSLQTVSTTFRSATERILTLFSNFGNRISERLNLQGLGNKITQTFRGITDRVKSSMSGMRGFFEKNMPFTTSKLSALGNRISSFFGGLRGRLGQLGTSISESFGRAFSNAGQRFQSFQRTLLNGFGNIVRTVQGVGNAFNNFGGNIKNAFSNLLGTGNQLQSMFSSMFGALSVFNLVRAGFNQITQSMDGAIDRFDTLNQFPRVMQQWGYSAEEANSSMDRLVDGIEGLPTSLDSITSSVQDFVVAGLDLDTATDAAIAFNNALLMNGTSAGEASAAMTQLNQMLAVGKVDQMAWNSLVRGAGKALDDVAKSMLGAEANQADLYAGLQSGQITLDEFVAKMIEMDQAVGGFAEQALIGSEGIRTAMSNLRTAVVRNLADMISAFDDALTSRGLGTIAQNLNDFKFVIDEAFGSIAEGIPRFVDSALSNLEELWAGFSDTGAVDSLKEAFDSVGRALQNVFENLDYEAIGRVVGQITDFFARATSAIGDFVANISADQLERITDVVLKFLIGMQAIKIGRKTFGFVRDIGSAFGQLGQDLGKVFGKKMPEAPAMPGADGQGTSLPTYSFTDSFGPVITNFAKNAGNLALVWGAVKVIQELAQAMEDINTKVSGNFLELVPKMANMGIALGAMYGFVRLTGRFAAANPAQAVSGLAMVAALSGEIMLASEALKQLNDKVPDDIGSVATKMASIAVGIGGMGVLVAAVGKLTMTDPASAIAGLAMVAALSLELMLAAEAMQQVNEKVPDTIGNFASKVVNIAIGIGSMAVLTQAVGILTMLNPAGAIAGLAMVAALSLELMLAAEAMQQVNEKVPDDIGSFGAKVANISLAIGAMGGLVLTIGTFTALNPIGAVAGLAMVTVLSGQLILAAEAISQVIAKVPEDISSVTSKIDGIVEVIQHFNDADLGGILSIFENAIGAVNTTVVTAGIYKMVDLAEAIKQLEVIELDGAKAKQTVVDIQGVIDSMSGANLGELIGSVIEAGQLSQALSSLQSMAQMAGPINSLAAADIQAEAAQTNINSIKQLVSSLQSSIFEGLFETMVTAEELVQARNAINAMGTMAGPINNLANASFEAEGAITQIETVKRVMRALDRNIIGQLFVNAITLEDVVGARNAINAMATLATPIQNLANLDIQAEGAISKIQTIREVMMALNRSVIGQWFVDAITLEDVVQARNAINAMVSLEAPINNLANVEILGGEATSNISKIKQVMASLGRASFGGYISDMVSVDEISQARSSINAMANMETSINNLANMAPNIDGAIASIDGVKRVIQALNTLPQASNVAGLQGLVNTFNQIRTAITNLNTSAQVSASGVVASFNRMGASATALRGRVSIAMTGMTQSVTQSMIAMRQSATSGMAGFNSAISSGMARAAATAASGSRRIVSVFRGMRGQMVSAGLYAMSGLAAGINAGSNRAISAARGVANRVTSTIRSALRIQSPSRIMMALGQFIPAGLALGMEQAGDLVSKASNHLADLATPSLPDNVIPLFDDASRYAQPPGLDNLTRQVLYEHILPKPFQLADKNQFIEVNGRVSGPSSEVVASDGSERPGLQTGQKIVNVYVTGDTHNTIASDYDFDQSVDKLVTAIEEAINASPDGGDVDA